MRIDNDEDFKKLKILMAEDDEINQALARNLFKKNGWNCDIVENGAKAIEKMRTFNYDLILLDVEMPQLNGYMTTMKIRNEFASPVSEVPIIAITAHVSTVELQKCIDVGMDGYIFKPIKLAELTAKIKSVFNGDGDTAMLDEKKSEPTNADQKSLLNLSGLYASCGNNPAIVKNIINLFVTQTPENMVKLENLLLIQDWENLKLLCHKMKSAYSLLGNVEIKSYLQEMEEDCAKNTVNVSKFQSYIAIIKGLNLGLMRELEKESI